MGRSSGPAVRDDEVTRLVLRTVDGVRDVDRVLALVAETRPDLVGPARTLVDAWLRSGLLVDTATWPPGIPWDELGHAVLRDRPTSPLAGRRRRAVRIHSAPGCHGLEELLVPALRLAGVSAPPGDRADLLVLVTAGDEPHSAVAVAGQAGLTTVTVVLEDGRARVGPWVEPGTTPCLWCADQARARWDPAWSSGRPVVDRCPSDLLGVGSELLLTVAGLVLHDVLAALDGRPTRLAGRRLTVGPDPTAVSTEAVPFSSRCCCHLLSDVS